MTTSYDRIIDYSGLTAPVPPDDVTAYRNWARSQGKPWASVSAGTIIALVFGGGAVLIAVLVVLVPALGLVITAGPIGLVALVVGLFFLALIGVGAFFAIRAVVGPGKWQRWVRLDKFARANGFVFSPADPDPNYPGAIFSSGYGRTAIDHLRTESGRFLDMGNYRYTTGSGKSQQTHQWGFLAFALDRSLPHMVLDSTANNGLFGGSNLPATFDKSQVLSLEGDFNRYFTLYCPREYETDALYVFTPDLMALLIDNAAPFDVEVIDTWMFVYSATPFASANPAVYQRLLRIVSTVGAKTLDQTERYRDERIGDFTRNVVAPPGQRLKRGFPVGAIIVIALVGAAFLLPNLIGVFAVLFGIASE